MAWHRPDASGCVLCDGPCTCKPDKIDRRKKKLTIAVPSAQPAPVQATAVEPAPAPVVQAKPALRLTPRKQSPVVPDVRPALSVQGSPRTPAPGLTLTAAPEDVELNAAIVVLGPLLAHEDRIKYSTLIENPSLETRREVWRRRRAT